jgi:sigma-B regulation protein RsbU (phosphoserine phosphatase)
MLSVSPERSFLYQAASDNATKYVISRPSEVVSRLNRHFLSNPGVSRFFTMIYGILDRQTVEFRYTAAGHFGPIHLSRSSARRIGETGGIPVGLLDSATYEEHRLTLSCGDRLYLCTDGIMEAANEAEEEFGEERLLETLDASRDSTLDDSLSSVMDRVEKWSAPGGARDDASMLAIECCD